MKYCMWPEAPETRRGSITLQFLSSPTARMITKTKWRPSAGVRHVGRASKEVRSGE